MNENLEAARALFTNIKNDLVNATTRLEHIRITALAQEAANLVALIESSEDSTGGQHSDAGSTSN